MEEDLSYAAQHDPEQDVVTRIPLSVWSRNQRWRNGTVPSYRSLREILPRGSDSIACSMKGFVVDQYQLYGLQGPCVNKATEDRHRV